MKDSAFEEYRGVSDHELALAACLGDIEARNALFLRLQQMISRSIHPARRLLVRLGNTAWIEPSDLEQEAFLIFCDLVDEWDPSRAPIVAYMAKMMRSRAYSYVRSATHLRSKRIKASRYRSLGAETILADVAQVEPPDNKVEGDERWDSLTSLLGADGKRFVEMKFYKDLSSEQIARANHCSVRTVNRVLRAALVEIRHCEVEAWEVV